MDKVKLCFVGCGGIAEWHLSHLLMFDDVVFVCFFDIVTEKADNFAKKTGGKRYDNLTTMLDTEKPDAVYICVPPAEHGEIEYEIIKRGIHFLVEKPVALDMAMITDICTKAQEAGLITAAGFQDRYLDIVDEMKKLLDGKKVGLITGAWVGGIPGVAWWRKKATSGGQLVEQNIHLFDLLRYLVGEPDTVYVRSGKGIVTDDICPGYDVEDFSTAVITFKDNSVIATLHTGCYQDGGVMKNGLTFYAADTTIDYALRDNVIITSEKDGRRTESRIKTRTDQGVTEDRAFLDAVKTGDQSKVRSPYADALKSMRFTLACNHSMDTCMPVKVDEFGR